MRSFNFLILIHCSTGFSVFVIKEDVQEIDNIKLTDNTAGSSEGSGPYGSGHSGSGLASSYSLSMTNQEDKYPAELIVREPISKTGFRFIFRQNEPPF